jgi:cytochrome c peroxidase
MHIFLSKNLTIRAVFGLAAVLIFLGFTQSVTLLNAESAAKSADSVAIKRVELGKILFFDPILSKNGKRSCASCHRPQKAFTDHRVTSRAYNFAENLDKNAPTLLHVSEQAFFFHDARLEKIEQVFEAVITNPKEFNFSYDSIMVRLNSFEAYKLLVRAAFPDKNSFTRTEVDESLKSYLATLKGSARTYGNLIAEKTRLEPITAQGYVLFLNKAACKNCHVLENSEQNLQTPLTTLLVNGKKIRVPSLRNVGLTEPYMSDGRTPNLEAVFEETLHADYLKKKGIQISAEERLQIIAFLNALSDTQNIDLSQPKTLPLVPGFSWRRVGGSY